MTIQSKERRIYNYIAFVTNTRKRFGSVLWPSKRGKKRIMTDEHVAPNGIQKRKKRNESITVDPTDILLGRGKSFKNHPGNILFQGTWVLSRVCPSN